MIDPDDVYNQAVMDLGRSKIREYYIDPTVANGGRIPTDVLREIVELAMIDGQAVVGGWVSTLLETAQIIEAKRLVERRCAALEEKLARAEAQLRDQTADKFGPFGGS